MPPTWAVPSEPIGQRQQAAGLGGGLLGRLQGGAGLDGQRQVQRVDVADAVQARQAEHDLAAVLRRHRAADHRRCCRPAAPPARRRRRRRRPRRQARPCWPGAPPRRCGRGRAGANPRHRRPCRRDRSAGRAHPPARAGGRSASRRKPGCRACGQPPGPAYRRVRGQTMAGGQARPCAGRVSGFFTSRRQRLCHRTDFIEWHDICLHFRSEIRLEIGCSVPGGMQWYGRFGPCAASSS